MFSNSLADEKSPYLLQHAHNPVEWFAWGEAAFAKARAENKPIFLSVGYSTCHWCHVMERESFENEETAALMNELFVNIKVDREERPDVDKLYMNFVMLANRGQGGWPMSVFLTPDLKPFYGGTYYPPQDAYGRPGFPSLLRSLDKAWREDNAKVLEAAGSSLQALTQFTEIESAPINQIDWDAIYQACNAQLRDSYDEEWAGFGNAPKFPRPVVHDFLHAFYARNGDETARLMSENTLRMMTDRGMNDQLGGGYHRYSVDQYWIVSHFEKMLYDQAQLAISLVEMFQISGDDYYAQSLDKVLSYVWRDMSHIDGGFYAAEDADSLPRPNALLKEEGAFYVWRKSEINDLLPQPDAQIFCDYYGVAPEGRAARVQLLRRDPDLGAEAELAAVDEAGRGVDQHGRAVHPGDEPARGLEVAGDDRLAVAGGPLPDVRDRLVDVVHDLGGDVERDVLHGPVLVGGLDHGRIGGPEVGVAVDGDVAAQQRGGDARDELRGHIAVHEDRLDGVAHAGPRHLGVDDDRLGHVQVGAGIDVDVHISDAGLDDRHRWRCLHHMGESAPRRRAG